MKKRRKRRIGIAYIIFWVLVLFMLAGFIISQAGTYNELRLELIHRQMEEAFEREVLHNLEIQLRFFDSDVYIEQLARERLGMIRPNEIVFRNVAE